MKNLMKYTFALLVAGWVVTPILAQNITVASSNSITSNSPTANYKGVYVVIKADTKPEMLMGIEEKLKKVGISFKVTEVTSKDGFITGVTVAVNVPGVYSGTITSGKNREPLASPIYFYSEDGKAGLSNGNIPPEISARGRLVVTDNLNGMVILHDNDTMELSGSAVTRWRSR